MVDVPRSLLFCSYATGVLILTICGMYANFNSCVIPILIGFYGAYNYDKLVLTWHLIFTVLSFIPDLIYATKKYNDTKEAGIFDHMLWVCVFAIVGKFLLFFINFIVRKKVDEARTANRLYGNY